MRLNSLLVLPLIFCVGVISVLVAGDSYDPPFDYEWVTLCRRRAEEYDVGNQLMGLANNAKNEAVMARYDAWLHFASDVQIESGDIKMERGSKVLTWATWQLLNSEIWRKSAVDKVNEGNLDGGKDDMRAAISMIMSAQASFNLAKDDFIAARDYYMGNNFDGIRE